MPTYEYACASCQNHWEEIQKISEEPLKVCPKCGKDTAKRQISGGNFILKGGGWYADLYSGSSNSKKSESSGDGSKAESSSTTKSETTKTKTEPPAKPSTGSGGSSGSSGGSGSTSSSG